LAALQEVIGTLENEIELQLNKIQEKIEDKAPVAGGRSSSCLCHSPFTAHVSLRWSAPPGGESESDTEAEVDDPSIRRLRSVLKGMMKKLEVRVKQTEDQLGKKLQQLDKDRDGILDSNELREAVMKILKKKDLSSEETQNFIQLLDQDNDGKGEMNLSSLSPLLLISLSY
jgi:signal recognition particle GTPase